MNTPLRTPAKRRQKQPAKRRRQKQAKPETRKLGHPGPPRSLPSWPVTEDWKGEIRRRIEERGWSQAEFARRIEASPAAITLIFKDNTHKTRLVPAIHKALGLVPPSLTMTVTPQAA